MLNIEDKTGKVCSLSKFRVQDFDLSAYPSAIRHIFNELPNDQYREQMSACMRYFQKHRCEATLKCYLRCLTTQEMNNRSFVEYANASAFQVHRAAAIYRSCAEFHQALYFLCKYVAGDWAPIDTEDLHRLQDHLLSSLTELKSIEKSSRRRVEKRAHDKDLYLLRNLGTEWYLQVWSEIAAHAVYGPATAVLALVGCRPSEFADSGVFVTRDRKSEDLVIRVNGAKVRDGAGQPWRVAKIDPNANQCARYLCSVLAKSGRRGIYVRLGCHGLLTREIARIGQMIWPELKENITCKTFRKMIGSKAKAAGWSKVQIAALLGHINTATQKWYGRAEYGGGGDFWIRDVIAPVAVRIDEFDLHAAADRAAKSAKIRLITRPSP